MDCPQLSIRSAHRRAPVRRTPGQPHRPAVPRPCDPRAVLFCISRMSARVPFDSAPRCPRLSRTVRPQGLQVPFSLSFRAPLPRRPWIAHPNKCGLARSQRMLITHASPQRPAPALRPRDSVGRLEFASPALAFCTTLSRADSSSAQRARSPALSAPRRRPLAATPHPMPLSLREAHRCVGCPARLPCPHRAAHAAVGKHARVPRSQIPAPGAASLGELFSRGSTRSRPFLRDATRAASRLTARLPRWAVPAPAGQRTPSALTPL